MWHGEAEGTRKPPANKSYLWGNIPISGNLRSMQTLQIVTQLFLAMVFWGWADGLTQYISSSLQAIYDHFQLAKKDYRRPGKATDTTGRLREDYRRQLFGKLYSNFTGTPREDCAKITEDNLKLWFKSNVSVLSFMHKNLIKEGRGLDLSPSKG